MANEPTREAMQLAEDYITPLLAEHAKGRPDVIRGVVVKFAETLDAFARDAVRAAVEKSRDAMCKGCRNKVPLNISGSSHVSPEGRWHPCIAIDIRAAFADVLEGRS